MTEDKTNSPPAKAPHRALPGFQRKFLRKQAHDLKPVVHVGEAGISDAVGRALTDALDQHELVKIKIHQPDDKKAAAEALARIGNAELCGIVGHTVILYRPNPETPKIVLPER
jgi:RNA-binding protein